MEQWREKEERVRKRRGAEDSLLISTSPTLTPLTQKAVTAVAHHRKTVTRNLSFFIAFTAILHCV